MCVGPAGEAVRVHGTLEPRGPAAALLLTEDQVEALGAGRTPPVRVTVAGHGAFDGRVGRMGGEILLGLDRQVRADLGVSVGDDLAVEMRLRDAGGAVDVPPALAAALDADPAARAAFDALAPSHREEYARWVAEAKQDRTRERRVAETLEGDRGGRPRRR